MTKGHRKDLIPVTAATLARQVQANCLPCNGEVHRQDSNPCNSCHSQNSSANTSASGQHSMVMQDSDLEALGLNVQRKQSPAAGSINMLTGRACGGQRARRSTCQSGSSFGSHSGQAASKDRVNWIHSESDSAGRAKGVWSPVHNT